MTKYQVRYPEIDISPTASPNQWIVTPVDGHAYFITSDVLDHYNLMYQIFDTANSDPNQLTFDYTSEGPA